MIKYSFLILFLNTLFVISVQAQGAFQAGLMSSVVLTDKKENDWSLIYEIDTRQLLKSGIFNGLTENEYECVLTDFSLPGAKKISPKSRLAGVYLLWIEEDEIFHRFIQQNTYTHQLDSLALNSRFSSDQTFSPAGKPIFRVRYRLATDVPLAGKTHRADEFYFKISNEYLNSWQDSVYHLEIRLLPLLGFNFRNDEKLEMGTDYRLDSFLQVHTRLSFWANKNLLIEI